MFLSMLFVETVKAVCVSQKWPEGTKYGGGGCVAG